jgi:parallel beta-helix repeat protein
MSFEISTGLAFVGNTVTGNGQAGLRILDSSSATVWHNTFAGNLRAVDLMDGARVSTNLATRGHDSRYGYDRALSWEVSDVDVRANIIGTDPRTARFGYGFDDARHRYSAGQRRLVLDYNGWYRTVNADTWLLAWGDWPRAMRTARNLAKIRALTGGEAHGQYGVAARNPWDARTGRTALGPGLPASVARLLGAAAGARLPIGAPGT